MSVSLSVLPACLCWPDAGQFWHCFLLLSLAMAAPALLVGQLLWSGWHHRLDGC